MATCGSSATFFLSFDWPIAMGAYMYNWDFTVHDFFYISTLIPHLAL